MTSPRAGILPAYLPLRGEIATSSWAVGRALSWMSRSSLKGLLSKAMTATTGRPRKLSPYSFLTLVAVHLIEGGDAVLTNVARRAAGLTEHQRRLLGVPDDLRYWNLTDVLDDLAVALLPADSPERVDLATGEILRPHVIGMTVPQFATRLLAASIPASLRVSPDLALDSTDHPSYSRPYRAKPTAAILAAAENLADDDAQSVADSVRPRVSTDPDARWGWRSKKNGTTTTHFLGYDMHLLVDVAPCGTSVRPALARGITVAPAGSSKTVAGLAALDAVKATTGTYPSVLLADRGYSPALPEKWALPLRARHISPVFDLHKTQRKAIPDPARGCVWIGGWPYSLAMPKGLWQDDDGNPREYESPVGIMTDEERTEREAAFDALTPWAYRPHSFNSTTGLRRYRPPQVRCPNHPGSLSLPYSFPTTDCAPGCTCGATISAGPEWLSREHQRYPFGSAAWRADYSRRVAVESYNAELKTNRANLARGTIHVFGLTKNSILLALFAGAVNTLMIRDMYDGEPTDDPTQPAPPLLRLREPRNKARHRLLEAAAALGPPS